MDKIRAERMDVTRNERDEVLISLTVPQTTAMRDPVLLFGRDGEVWRAALRDAANQKAAPIMLPPLPPSAVKWLEEAPPYGAALGATNRFPGDMRTKGVRYALICEVVGGNPVNGYFARIMPSEIKSERVSDGAERRAAGKR